MTLLTGIPSVLPAEIPSPTQSVWYLGPVPIRAYAMAILAGIVVAVWLTNRRLIAGGAPAGAALDISAWAVPFGIVGGRLYHVITDSHLYFGAGKNPWDALRVWEGGLGIWGAIALGALGAWIGCRQAGVSFLLFIDAAAPGVAIAQAMGRLGNWFNNELHGGPTDLPWRLKVYEFDQSAGRALVGPDGNPIVDGYFHPTFLYEAIWCLALAAVLIWIGRRFTLKPGQTFAAYVMGYPIGRIVIENMRTDEATHVFGQRINTWTSILVFLLGLALWFSFQRRAARVAAARAEAEDQSEGAGEPADGATDEATDEPADQTSDDPKESDDPADQTWDDPKESSVGVAPADERAAPRADRASD
ncbi:MAG TPA: prolipoprotein diacylglyceryl transferase, partial [Actinomycetota bacterium]|nr:prolipoprotein diacylglyceryl transferase [Actinomycetota bacterium]